MAFIMKEDESLNPFDVGLFGAVGVVPDAQAFANLVEQFFPGGV